MNERIIQVCICIKVACASSLSKLKVMCASSLNINNQGVNPPPQAVFLYIHGTTVDLENSNNLQHTQNMFK